MYLPPHSNSPYTGVHQPSPYSPGAGRAGSFPDAVIPTVWTDDDKRDPEEAVRMVPLRQITTEHMYDTSVTTTERLYDGGVRITPLPSGHRVEEVTLEVPVSHDKLYDMLFAVDATIDNRRANGVTIPEESRTVTTLGNEIVIRWEERS